MCVFILYVCLLCKFLEPKVEQKLLDRTKCTHNTYILGQNMENLGTNFHFGQQSLLFPKLLVIICKTRYVGLGL